MLTLSGRAVRWGVLAAAGLLGFYLAVIVAASGPAHLRAQLALDWPWITVIVAGFGIQTALLITLRERSGPGPLQWQEPVPARRWWGCSPAVPIT